MHNDIQNNGTFNVKNGADVRLYAGNSIILEFGFTVEAGGLFIADSEPCD